MIERLGRYRIEGLIAEGGMSTVYRAVHSGTDAAAALKVLKPEVTRDADLKGSMWGGMEGEIHHEFNHRNVVRTYEFGRDGDHYFIAMEFIPGRRLDQYMDDATLSAEEKGTIVGQILSGAHYIHQQHVIHRDLCPKNILVVDDGGLLSAKIIDFGVAIPFKLAREIHERGLRDRAGTSGYMSPEQARGDLNDERTDVYGLGATLYRMETGKRPFRDYSSGHSGGDEAAYRFGVMVTVSQFKLIPPSGINPAVSPELEAVIMKAMEKDPDRRYQSVQHILRDLRAIGYVPKGFSPERRQGRRRPGGATAVAYRLPGRSGLVRRKGRVRDHGGEFVSFHTSKDPPRMGDSITVTLDRGTFQGLVTRVHPTSSGYDVVVELRGS